MLHSLENGPVILLSLHLYCLTELNKMITLIVQLPRGTEEDKQLPNVQMSPSCYTTNKRFREASPDLALCMDGHIFCVMVKQTRGDILASHPNSHRC